MSKSDRDRKSVAFAAHFLSSDSTFVDIYQEQKKTKTTLTDLLFFGQTTACFLVLWQMLRWETSIATDLEMCVNKELSAFVFSSCGAGL